MSEVEECLNRIKTHKGVLGICVVNSDGVPIRSTLDKQTTNQYSLHLSSLCNRSRSIIRDLDPTNDLKFLRIRTKKHEVLIAPDKDYILVVIQDPNVGADS